MTAATEARVEVLVPVPGAQRAVARAALLVCLAPVARQRLVQQAAGVRLARRALARPAWAARHRALAREAPGVAARTVPAIAEPCVHARSFAQPASANVNTPLSFALTSSQRC